MDPDTSPAWPCSRCTFVNTTGSSDTCAMCMGKRDVKRRRPAVAAGEGSALAATRAETAAPVIIARRPTKPHPPKALRDPLSGLAPAPRGSCGALLQVPTSAAAATAPPSSGAASAPARAVTAEVAFDNAQYVFTAYCVSSLASGEGARGMITSTRWANEVRRAKARAGAAGVR